MEFTSGVSTTMSCLGDLPVVESGALDSLLLLYCCLSLSSALLILVPCISVPRGWVHVYLQLLYPLDESALYCSVMTSFIVPVFGYFV